MYYRYLNTELPSLLSPGKVFVLYGPRRAGKTTLIQNFLPTVKFKYRMESGEDIRFREVFESQSVQTIRQYVEGYDLLIIDEAQRISNVGLGLKLLVDHVPSIRVIATGSASFDLANKIGEPLTGRKITRILYPLSQLELSQNRPPQEMRDQLESFLLFGSYPEVLTQSTKQQKIEILRELSGSYLFKDILELERVKSPKALLDILRLLAFQVGKDVSLTEIGTQVGLDYKTVQRYLDLLEKAFVLKSLGGFSKNLRKEVSKGKRYYFLDTGIRNTIISNFNELKLRDDIGQLWENFIFIERLKRNESLRIYANQYYWRTYQKEEVDLVEEIDGQLHGFEMKYSDTRIKSGKAFVKKYPGATLEVINQGNFLDWVAK